MRSSNRVTVIDRSGHNSRESSSVHVQSCRYLHWSTRFTAKPVIRSSHSINVGVSETQLLRPVAGMQPAEHDPLQFGSEVTQVGAA